ncbi:hypothetical protein ANN_18171 [Periplaneta americana]|uniref:Uncharacterized protein n=1 Tax=Periplaneta americana TaxID=6978 RepID=A0ABQ8SQ38_PERAM|nr:hypothetical protein ANN_18171 [Periplaneta americana]
MSPGSSTESYPAFARIGLRENPGKNLNQLNTVAYNIDQRKEIKDSEETYRAQFRDSFMVVVTILRRTERESKSKGQRKSLRFYEAFGNITPAAITPSKLGLHSPSPPPLLYSVVEALEKSGAEVGDEIVIMDVSIAITRRNRSADIRPFSLLSKNLKVRIYKTVILPVVLYGCETWTLTLREEHRFRVFENKVLRKIFGAKRDEVTGEWRKLYNTELHALYSSPDIIRNIKSRCLRWAGHAARMGESRNAYRVLVGRPEGKRPVGWPRRRWEDNKMDLREVGYDNRDWINLAQDRDRWRAYVRAAMNLRIP